MGLLAGFFIAAAAIFLILEILPGDPAAVMLGFNAPPETVAALHAEYGLDRPAWARFASWILGLAHGDMGMSFSYRVPVAALVLERLDVTLPLAALSFAITLLLGIGLGALAALRAQSTGDAMLRILAQLALSIPNFWVGLLLILALAVTLKLFPAGGFPGWQAGFMAGLKALLLPAIALSLAQGAILLRVTRAALLDILGEPYMRTARAKGLSRSASLWCHALGNALPPIVTLASLQLAFLFTGVIVIENVFSLPGIGKLMFQGVTQHDIPLVQNLILIFVAFVLLVNFCANALLAFIDPRLRRQERAP